MRHAESFGDQPHAPGALFPQEAALVARAVETRRREFATARACARRALADVGVAPVALLPGPHGALIWPAGTVGSITHCNGYRAAAVADSERADVASLGIDAEPHRPLPPGLIETITRPGELPAVRSLLARRPTVRWDTLLFSAKEAVYKACFPRYGAALGFEDASIEFDTRTGRFTATLHVPDPPGPLSGRWFTGGGLALTSVVIPRERAAVGAALAA
ncbi:4'-phosphopantetheinyl transferase [Kitasatospora sp. NPDC057223]|uniref:4'-phosphopantetheinyl transferase family protein n=1 Tax=Kitasatospora sp. NPDC057223 TaxID=3346055 RepID=UPI0036373E3A